MGSFAAYYKLKPTALKRVAKESIEGITKWFKDNPQKKQCDAELWYGVRHIFKPKDDVAAFINDLLERTLKSDAEDDSKFAKRP
jgi:hypothetical protein